METITLTITVPAVFSRKVAKHDFTFDWRKVPAEKLEELVAYQLAYGSECVSNAANTAAKAWRDADPATRKDATYPYESAKTFADAWHDGTIAEKARRAGGGSATDPVTNEARKLAQGDILGLLCVGTWKEAAAHEKGKAFFKVTEKQNVLPIVEAVDAFIEKNDAVAKYRERAEAIVAAAKVERPAGLSL